VKAGGGGGGRTVFSFSQSLDLVAPLTNYKGVQKVMCCCARLDVLCFGLQISAFSYYGLDCEVQGCGCLDNSVHCCSLKSGGHRCRFGSMVHCWRGHAVTQGAAPHHVFACTADEQWWRQRLHCTCTAGLCVTTVVPRHQGLVANP